jgi:hypothetical protein
MKEFKNLQEAFGHQTKCPFCTHRTQLAYNRIESIYGRDKTTEIVTLKTGSIQFVIDGIDNTMLECHSGGSILSGVMMFSVFGTCTNCTRYAFALGVSVDITNKKLTSLFLNSETFSFEKAEALHEIRNVYTTGKTEYVYFPADAAGSTGTVTLPLIPFDVAAPEKTLDRIKGLLVFL